MNKLVLIKAKVAQLRYVSAKDSDKNNLDLEETLIESPEKWKIKALLHCNFMAVNYC